MGLPTTPWSEREAAGLSWVLNAYNIVFAAFLVASGQIADLLGRRRVFLLGLIVFTAASALCAAAPSVASLVAFRVVQALGAALLVPASLGAVLEAFGAERRAHAVALLTAVGAVAAGIGPLLGGLLVSASSWRLVFLVNVPVGIAAFMLSRRHLDESRAPGRRRIPDLSGALMFALSVAALVLGVIKGAEWGWASPRVIGSFAVAAILAAVVAWRCTWHRSPVVDLGLLRVRTFATANAMSVLSAAGFYGYTLANVLFLTGVWGYSVLAAGLAITPGPFVAAAVAGPSSRLAERYGHRVVLVVGGVVWAAAVAWLALRVGATPAFVTEWLPATVLLGIGAGITLPNLGGAAIASAPGEAFATATGLNSVARQVGAALGVAIVVALIGSPSSIEAATLVFDHAWWFAAGCLLASGVGCLGIGRLDAGTTSRRRRRSRAPPLPCSRPRRGRLHRRNRRRPSPGSPPSPAGRGTARCVPRAWRRSSRALHCSRASGRRCAASWPSVRATCGSSAGEWLFRQGDEGDAMYVVRAGRLEVVKEDDGPADVVELGRGAAVGELALLTSSPRSASVRAARDSDLIAIDREDFQRLLRAAPELPLAMIGVLGEHLRASRPAARAIRPLPSTIALLALDDAVPLAELAARLARALGRAGRVAVLDGSETERPSAGASPVETYGPLLDRAERSSDRVILVAGGRAAGDPWFEFCVQQGDRLLAIAHERAPEHPVAVAGLRGCDLVGYAVLAGSAVLAGWAAALEPVEAHSLSAGPELAARRRPPRPPAHRPVGGRRALGRGSARLLAPRRARGARRRRHHDRPRRRREHGRVHRWHVRRRQGRRRDGGHVLRGVGASPAARRLHASPATH